MATCHLITYADFTTLRDINFCHLNDTIGQLVTDSQVEFLALEAGIQLFVLSNVVHDTTTYQIIDMSIRGPISQHQRNVIQILQARCSKRYTLRDNNSVHAILNTQRYMIREQRGKFAYEQRLELSSADCEISIEFSQNLLILQLLLAILDSLLVEILINNYTAQRWTSLQGSILNITSLITEDRLEKFLFRRWIGLTLRSNLTDDDITGLDMSTDANNTMLIQILGSLLTHVGYICCELLHTTFGLAHL